MAETESSGNIIFKLLFFVFLTFQALVYVSVRFMSYSYQIYLSISTDKLGTIV